MNKKYLIFNLLLLNFLLMGTKFTFAVDYFLENNGEIDIVIARDEINRIKVSNDRIKNLKANEDELKIEVEKNGEIYVKPLYGRDDITLFITTENNSTYKLNLKSKDIKSQQIFINKKVLH